MIVWWYTCFTVKERSTKHKRAKLIKKYLHCETRLDGSKAVRKKIHKARKQGRVVKVG